MFGEFEYVQRVVDDDTLLLGTGELVRLIGVNTPESVRPNTPVQRFSKEAADFTRRRQKTSVCGWNMTKQTRCYTVGRHSGYTAKMAAFPGLNILTMLDIS
jgi:Staphylococcal nuclease homologue